MSDRSQAILFTTDQQFALCRSRQIEYLAEHAKAVPSGEKKDGYDIWLVQLSLEDLNETFASLPELALCDFCGGEGVEFEYPTANHATVVMYDSGETDTEYSSGAWLACPDCHALIEEGDHGKLAEHSERVHFETGRHPVEARAEARKVITAAHEGFWRSRQGDAKAITTKEET